MATIRLTNGKSAEVDDDLVEYLSGFRWYFIPRPRANGGESHGYAATTIAGKTTYMHRLILAAIGKFEIDHRDGNGLNNLASNLRRSTRRQNGMNQKKQAGKSSRLKGVTFDRFTGTWKAQIMQDARNYHLGRFNSEQEAGEAYDREAKRRFGEFAKLNFRQDKPTQ